MTEQIDSDSENEIFSTNKRKLNDYNMKMRLAKNLVSAIITDGNSFTENISGSLGIPNEVILEEKKEKNYRRTFQKQLANYQINFRFSQEAVRKFLIDNYLKNQTVPSMEALFSYMQRKARFSKINYQTNILCEHRFQMLRQLKTQGFVMKSLPKTNRFIFMEDAKHLATRMRYLEIVRDQRQIKKNLVYVSKLTKDNTHMHVAASPSQGVISACNSLPSYEWFEKILSPLLPPSSVVVIDETIELDHTIITPNIYSNKSEMLKWLNFKDIPHRHSMHRAELYDLIVKYKKQHSTNASILEEVAKVYDSEILILPSDLRDLNYFNPLVQFYLSKTTLSVKSLSQIDQSMWESFETILISNENKIYEEDMQMELFIDNLMTMAANEELTEEDMGPDVNEGLFKTTIDYDKIFKF